jgi:type II secretion system protein N
VRALTGKEKRILLWAAIPAFYFFSLTLFVRLTFPYETLRQRVLTEFNRTQRDRVLTVEGMSGSGLFGVEAEGLVLRDALPVDDPKAKEVPPALRLDSLTVGVSFLAYVFGNVSVDFDAELGGGTISGEYAQSDEKAEIDLDMADVDVSGLKLLANTIGLPLQGTLSGVVSLVLPERQMNKAEGTLDVSIGDLKVGDGKAKIRNTIALPEIQAGTLTLKAVATDGRLDIKSFGCDGPDFEMTSSGRVRLRQPFDRSAADLEVGFRFKDAYTNKSEITKTLFGSSDSKVPGLFDMDPNVRRAKGADKFYRWRVIGAVSAPAFRPATPGGRRGADGAGDGE